MYSVYLYFPIVKKDVIHMDNVLLDYSAFA